MTIGTRAAFKRAIGRACELRGWERVTELGGGTYAVAGRMGDRYTVGVDADGEYACSCPAGVHGAACWHQASVYLVRAQRAAFKPLARAVPTDSDCGRPSGRGESWDEEDGVSAILAAMGVR